MAIPMIGCVKWIGTTWELPVVGQCGRLAHQVVSGIDDTGVQRRPATAAHVTGQTVFSR